VPPAYVARGLPQDVDPVLARGLEALAADFAEPGQAFGQ